MLIFTLMVIVNSLKGSCLAQNFLFSENDTAYKVVILIFFCPKLTDLGVDVKIKKHCPRSTWYISAVTFAPSLLELVLQQFWEIF